jgi:hypothetical protein
MKGNIEPSDLDTLMNLTYPLRGYSVVRELPREGPKRAKVRIEVLSTIISTNLTETFYENNNEEEEEGETVAEGIPVLLHMSNAHIEAMILQDLGPQFDEESSDILKRIRMNPKTMANSNMVLATTYKSYGRMRCNGVQRTYLVREPSSSSSWIGYTPGNLLPLSRSTDTERSRSA